MTFAGDMWICFCSISRAFFGIGATSHTCREIKCLPYAFLKEYSQNWFYNIPTLRDSNLGKSKPNEVSVRGFQSAYKLLHILEVKWHANNLAWAGKLSSRKQRKYQWNAKYVVFISCKCGVSLEIKEVDPFLGEDWGHFKTAIV